MDATLKNKNKTIDQLLILETFYDDLLEENTITNTDGKYHVEISDYDSSIDRKYYVEISDSDSSNYDSSNYEVDNPIVQQSKHFAKKSKKRGKKKFKKKSPNKHF